MSARRPAPAWLVRLIRLTRGEYFADFAITPPLTLAATLWSLAHGFGPLWVVEALAGWAWWTLYEYAVHRASHHLPWLVDLHRLHHRNVKDYIGLHPAATLAIYGLVWLAFGFAAAPFAIGFSVGYVAYAAIHTAFHHAVIEKGGWLGEWLWPMKQRHVAHHRFGNRAYGVTTGVWDRLFGTG